MKRKLVYISVSYAVGLIFASMSLEKYGITVIFAGFLIFFSICRAINTDVKKIAVILIPLVISFCVYRFYNFYVYETLLKYNNTEGYFSGKITDITDYGQDNSGYILDGTINNIIDAKIFCYNSSYNCKTGDIMSFNCTFKDFDSDYLFDSREYYKQKNIYLSADDIKNLQITENNDFLLRNMLYDYRNRMISEFRLNMDKDTSAFLSAMVFGDKSDIDSYSKTMLYRCGIGHIMAVSGIHISICAGFIILILKKLRMNKFISFGIICLFLSAMVIITKFPVSAVRASIMTILFYSAGFFRRENNTLNSLALAVLIICVSNPFAIHNQGFLLSVSGTYGAGVFAPYMTKNIDSKIIKNLLSMFLISVCVMPLSILYFDEVSIIAPLANMIFIPLCSIALLIGLVFVMSGGLINLLFIAKYIIKMITFAVNLMGNSQWIYISGNSYTVFIVLISLFVFGLCVYLLTKSRKNINAVILCGIIFMFVYNQILHIGSKDIFEIAFLGKGRNVCAVITYNGNADVIDLSGYFKSPQYVKKYLSENHIRSINNLIISKNYFSVSPSYKSALEFSDVENIYRCSENKIQLKYNNYNFSCNNGVLTVSYDKYSVFVSPYIYNGETADIFIFYGKPKNKNLPEKFIACNQDCNNFSLKFTEKSLSVRRL